MKCNVCNEQRNTKTAKQCIEVEGMCPSCLNSKKYGWKHVGRGRFSDEVS